MTYSGHAFSGDTQSVPGRRRGWGGREHLGIGLICISYNTFKVYNVVR